MEKVYDFQKICEYFGKDASYFITGQQCNGGGEITEIESRVLVAYKKLSESDKRIVDFILRNER